MSLILHCGTQATTRASLFALPDPKPISERHQPIHHAAFLEEVEGALGAAGYAMRDTAFGVTHDGNRFFGLSTIEHEQLRAFDGGSFVIGFRGSHDMSTSRGLAVGSHVFVCNNLCFWGDFQLSTKHTTYIHQRLPIMLEEMVARLKMWCARQYEQLDAYRSTQIDDSAADAAILAMGRQGIINWGELGKVVHEWDQPSHDEHAEDGPTVWRLFNAATANMKLRNPDHPRVTRTMGDGVKLHRICDKLAELPLAA